MSNVGARVERISVPAPKRHMLHVQLRGTLQAPTPAGRINQAWAAAIDSAESISLVDFERSHDVLRTANAAAGTVLITLSNTDFPRVLPSLHGRYIFVAPYGTVALDDERLEQAKALCDDVWFFCEHAREDAVARGLDERRAFLVPLGIDTELFTPDGPNGRPLIRDRFTFLYIGALTEASRFALVLDAFEQEFGEDEPVVCAMREWSHTARAADAEEQLVLQNRIAAMQAGRQPRFYALSTPLDPAVAARLYRSADALLHPQMHDDGAIQLLEAAACGLPVLKPSSSAESYGRYSCYRSFDAPEPGSNDVTELRRLMRYAYEHHMELSRQAATQSEAVRAEHALSSMTAAVLERVQAVAQRSEPLQRSAQRSTSADLASFEAQAYSQNGEDGVLDEIFRRLGVTSGYFAEFGVETGRECNAAIFARLYGWRGLFMEGDPTDARALAANYARFSGVRTACHMLDRDNIARLFERYHVPHELDLLVVDVDGNDFYLWQALAAYRAKVAVVEINPAYPPPEDWVMEYNPRHVWQRDAYYGASLQSMTRLADTLGYALIALDATSTNAIFVRRELLPTVGFVERTPSELYRPPPNLRTISDRPAHRGAEVFGLLSRS